MNKLIVTAMFFSISEFLFSQNTSIKHENLFDSTVEILSQINKIPGARDVKISNNVISLVYHTEDSIISLERKIDLIFLVSKEIYSYRELCSSIDNKIETDTTIKNANKLLLLPFCNCNVVINPILSQINEKIDSVTFFKMLEIIPKDYGTFYKFLFRRINTVINSNSDIRSAYIIDYYGLYDAFIKPSLRKKYPSCFNE